MLALLALLPLLAFPAFASPTPLSKRYTNVRIRSNRSGLCLSAAPKTGVGSQVTVTSCDDFWAHTWTINPGSGSVLLGDGSSGLALDAGTNPADGGKLKVWTSYPGLYQQTWYLTDDNRIAITGGTQCLDDGGDGVGAQTWTCTTGNTNQIWYVEGTGPSPSSSSSAAPSSTPSSTPSGAYSDIPVNPNYPGDPADGGRRIRVGGRNDLCLTVQNGYAGQGTNVAISSCFSNGDYFLDEQLWDLPQGTGQVKLHRHPDLCLDAGINPGDGSKGMKIWTCLDVPQQQWTFSNGLLSTTNGQCLDVEKESGPSYNKPYQSLKSVQTWTCSQPDPYQAFQLYDGPGVGQ
ncbi:ricin B lectin domain-containing protein [Papiliotrema laurentii]|uniref:Ricin B lectin domain-containing protein n=1 Tax=Papiliotrema laurentii TaxID=5418 RepID=A0AAD9FNA7_PAPLA|nr:ricin B lectin domain-containing protein [Papiliotrema laurentii]